MKHKHLYKKISSKLEKQPNMFQHLIEKDLGTYNTLVTRFRCKCGDIQEFHDLPSGKWNRTLPEEFLIRK